MFSPSIDIDATWEPVKKYQSEKMKVLENEKEKLYFNSYDPDDLDKIITTQHKVTKLMKTQGRKSYVQFWLLLMISLTTRA